MHYNIGNILIKSEYAAKSVKQPSKEVMKFINMFPKKISVLDYGCGKLRYTIPLSSKVSKVYAVDSSEQINRTQLINGVNTDIRSYCKKYLKNVQIYDLDDYLWKNNKYDIIICCNVLSAVPIYKERINILRNIKETLNDNGRAIISTQFRNSYFDTYKKRLNCTNFYDGWIIKNKNSCAFYGIINLKKITYYARKIGLNIEKAYSKNGSAYVILSKNVNL